MLARITQQDVVYRRYLVSTHRSYVPDFGVYITIQGANGDVEFRSLSRQLVLFCVERRKAWRMLQSKAGIENRDYKAQRAAGRCRFREDLDGGFLGARRSAAEGAAARSCRAQACGGKGFGSLRPRGSAAMAKARQRRCCLIMQPFFYNPGDPLHEA